ncbi:rhamnosyltransferase [Selenomonas ruminantium]|uniref:Rhamnosyltransferase n=1 Tax=Selenomonas ruminantium TaxID=971 RepID=A0A1I3BXP6_SELRU|nr:glycosyltransferase [Selenomonas ruminantium]SFH67128.1 rhamnosyltransferase [Selenomonas ruminantium]
MKFVAIVVLYNPAGDVIDNIKSYSNSVEKVYAIDNSEEVSQDILDELNKIDNIVYIPFNENKGVAYALNIGLKKALSEKADYLLTMDQDTAFRKDDAEKMINYIQNNNDYTIGIYAANTEEYTGSNDAEKVNLVLTSGNIINCDIVSEIGGYDTDLFIDWVDNDICYRLMNYGKNIMRINKVKIDHHLGEKQYVNILGYKYSYVTHNALRYYYMTRNKFYVLKKNRMPLIYRIRFVFGTIKLIFGVLIIEKDKLLRLKYIFRGLKDCYCCRYGKYNN